MPSRLPSSEGQPSGRGGEYRLLVLAEQQIEQLQVFSARLQQQIRQLQARLREAEERAERSRPCAAEAPPASQGAAERPQEARQAPFDDSGPEALRLILPGLLERLERLKALAAAPSSEGQPSPASVVAEVSSQLEALERAYGRFLQASTVPSPSSTLEAMVAPAVGQNSSASPAPAFFEERGSDPPAPSVPISALEDLALKAETGSLARRPGEFGVRRRLAFGVMAAAVVLWLASRGCAPSPSPAPDRAPRPPASARNRRP